MQICLCNTFNCKKLKEAVKALPNATVAEIYKACSGGEKPVCGSCAPVIVQARKDAKNATPA